MIDPQAIVDQFGAALKENAIGFKRVELAWTLTPDPEIEDVPATFVVPWKEKAVSNADYGTYKTVQVVGDQFVFMTVCELAQLKQRRQQIRTLVHGKQLTGYDFVNQFVEGEVLALNRSIIWWVDVYAAQCEWRSSNS